MTMKLLLVVLLASSCASVYLPGVTPKEYSIGEEVPVTVNSVKSIRTAIPYDYYSLMFCRPSDKLKKEPENFGEMLWGESVKPSKYGIRMRMNVQCARLCTTSSLDVTDDKSKKPLSDSAKHRRNPVRKLKTRIDDEYRGHILLDQLPVSEVFIWEKAKQDQFHKRGYQLGIPGNNTVPTYVYNHLAFTVKYHKPDPQATKYRVVGFTVTPYSIDSHIIDTQCEKSDIESFKSTGQPVVYHEPKKMKSSKKPTWYSLPETTRISWSYSVKWEEDSELAWSSRWDVYLKAADTHDSKIHYFGIINSLLVVLILAIIVAGILFRVLHRDFNRYNSTDNEYEQQEEIGWKLVHGDVFREPPYASVLAVLLGMGTQLYAMTAVTCVVAVFGFLSPANRGYLLIALVILYVIMSILGGCVSAKVAQCFHIAEWKIPLQTATLVPGQVFLVFFTINLAMWGLNASNAVPFSIMFFLVFLWFFVSIPLTLFGGLIGYKSNRWVPPLAVNQVPRAIPTQPWFLRAWTIPLAGLVPFMACFIEASFILSSLWQNHYYQMFGFLGIVLIILLAACCETAIVGTYFQLCFEDHRWWWRSFALTGSCGPLLFVYSVYYFFTALNITKFWSAVLYFGYMGVISYLFGIVTGTVGFFASFVFVNHIYVSIKLE